ncbi:MAG: FAD-dependent oxidoreductase [Candidatus Paceibacterota bacterium]|jgi:protoporphyrinogen oxidase
MKIVKTETLIIGAGPAGLATAMELSKAGKEFILIERQASVGGLSKTYTFTESDGLTFYTDNGPHRFFSKNPHLYKFIEDILHEKWIKVRRQTRQFIDGKFYDYPVNAPQALRNLGTSKAIRMGIDYAIAKLHYGLFRKKIASFEDYVVANFGRSLGEFSMINYTEKIWGISAKDIHPDWAAQRIKGLSFISLLKEAGAKLFVAGGGRKKPKSLIDTFYYPAQGTGLIYETIKTRLLEKGYRVLLNTAPKTFQHANGTIYSVVVDSPEGELLFECKQVVESIPMTEFVKMLRPLPPKPILESLAKLRHRSQVYLFVTLNKESVTPDQWIYFPSKHVPIGRVSEMKNFSSHMSPPGKTSLFIEYFCFEGDEVWNMNAEQLFAYTLPYILEAGLFTAAEVRNYYMIKQKNVYPIYDLHYKEYLSVVKNYLDTFTNLFYIGRPGRFRYNNQDHSLEMGMLAAKSIIDGTHYDIESVGEEKEYFEKGTVPSGTTGA